MTLETTTAPATQACVELASVFQHELLEDPTNCLDADQRRQQRALQAHAPNRKLQPSEVARLRAAHPDVSLETLAERLGCSLSTVKRHLRRVRNQRPQERDRRPVRPSLEQVLHAAHLVLGSTELRRRLAA